MLWTWQHGDIGLTEGFDGDTERALRSIRAHAIVMPAEKDLYFPPEDNAWEVERMPNAELRVIPGIWGHFAGGGANPADTAFIDQGLKDLLSMLVRAEPAASSSEPRKRLNKRPGDG
jgi:homoserine O-acetyltransferase